MPADRGTSSKSPRFIRHRRRFGDFPSQSAAAFRGVRYENLSFQQAVGADAEKGGQGTQLDIRDEALACLDALHGVFIQIQPHQLQLIGQRPLGQPRRPGQPHRRPDTALSPSGRVMQAVSPVTVFSAAR